jgi:hypothetical protein
MIYFDGNIHVYYNTEGIIYDSPSKVFAKYKNKFDADGVAKRYALKHGETAAFWKAKWEKERDASLERGTGIHQTKEDLMFGRGIDKFKGRTMTVQNADLYLAGAVRDLHDLPDGIYPEIPIWNHNWRISGKPDKLVLDTTRAGGVPKRWAHIDDFKTNKSIDKISYQFPDGDYKRMKKPLEHLMDCNWMHYGLQLSFYLYIMESAGFTPGELKLIHIPHPTRDDQGQVIAQPEDVLYTLPYMKPEIVLTLTDYNKGRKLQYYKDVKHKHK